MRTKDQIMLEGLYENASEPYRPMESWDAYQMIMWRIKNNEFEKISEKEFKLVSDKLEYAYDVVVAFLKAGKIDSVPEFLIKSIIVDQMGRSLNAIIADLALSESDIPNAIASALASTNSYECSNASIIYLINSKTKKIKGIPDSIINVASQDKNDSKELVGYAISYGTELEDIPDNLIQAVFEEGNFGDISKVVVSIVYQKLLLSSSYQIPLSVFNFFAGGNRNMGWYLMKQIINRCDKTETAMRNVTKEFVDSVFSEQVGFLKETLQNDNQVVVILKMAKMVDSAPLPEWYLREVPFPLILQSSIV